MAAKKPALNLATLLADASRRSGRIRTCGTCSTEYANGRACPSCDPRPVVEHDQFIAMLQRQLRVLERRAIDDPAILAQVLMLAQSLAEMVNVVVAVSSDSHKIDPMAAPSMREIARMLGISAPSAQQRVDNGQRTIMARLEALGISSLALAQREREAREAAKRHAAETMPKWSATRGHLRAVG